MLQAITKEGKLLTLASLTRKEIIHLRTDTSFFCPVCKKQVILKAGNKVIPHFAHRKSEDCPSREGGEGPYHEKGKFMLYQWLKYQGINVRLEVFLSEIKQRPDLLITINRKQIALEYQCARISSEEIRRRNIGYRKLGIQPIWIMGANRFIRTGANHLKLDAFLRHFLHQFSPEFPLTCYFFSPDQQTLITFQDIYMTSTLQAIGELSFKKLRDITIIDLFKEKQLPKKQLYTLWNREKQRFRLRSWHTRSKRERAWLQWLYVKRTHLEYLPSIIHLPVEAQYRMKTPPWNWQSRICLELLDPLPVGGHITVKNCVHSLSDHFIPRAEFPLIFSESHPIYQYLLLLEHFHILKQSSPFHFNKQQHLSFYKNVEDAVTGDKKLLQILQTKKKIKIQA